MEDPLRRRFRLRPNLRFNAHLCSPASSNSTFLPPQHQDLSSASGKILKSATVRAGGGGKEWGLLEDGEGEGEGEGEALHPMEKDALEEAVGREGEEGRAEGGAVDGAGPGTGAEGGDEAVSEGQWTCCGWILVPVLEID